MAFDPHGIQLVFISVDELSIILNYSALTNEVTADDAVLDFQPPFYDPESKLVRVSLGLGLKDSEDKPYKLTVKLAGFFRVDDAVFDVKHLEHWGKYNAPYILMPYIREHVYSLTQKAGHTPLILPMVEIPIPKEDSKKKLGEKNPERSLPSKSEKDSEESPE